MTPSAFLFIMNYAKLPICLQLTLMSKGENLNGSLTMQVKSPCNCWESSMLLASSGG